MTVYCYIPTADSKWALRQNREVNLLFGECWLSDPYGGEWTELMETKLKKAALTRAMAKLSAQGLFAFKQLEDGRWMVKNLHGSTVVEFWGCEMENPPRQSVK